MFKIWTHLPTTSTMDVIIEIMVGTTEYRQKSNKVVDKEDDACYVDPVAVVEYAFVLAEHYEPWPTRVQFGEYIGRDKAWLLGKAQAIKDILPKCEGCGAVSDYIVYDGEYWCTKCTLEGVDDATAPCMYQSA